MDLYEVAVIALVIGGAVLTFREVRILSIARSRRIQKEMLIEDRRSKEVNLDTFLDNLPLMLQNQRNLRNEMAKRNATDLQLKPIDDQIHFLETAAKYGEMVRPFTPLINPIINEVPKTIIGWIRGLM